MYLNNIFYIINIPLPDEIAELQNRIGNIVEGELDRNYGSEDGEINDSSLDEMMEPLYDEHSGTLFALIIRKV